jgi:serine/threonine protein phosphatase 1
MSLTFAIGDIHGCFSKLEALIAQCTAYAGHRQFRFVFLGDYVDRGPDRCFSPRWQTRAR